MAITAACVNIIAPNNATWEDAFTFGVVGDVSWNFVGQSFRMDIKASNADAAALLSLTSAGGTIVVDSTSLRVLHFNVPEASIQASLPVGDYVYDLIMFDASVPNIRVPLMQGIVTITQGVTGG